LVLVSVMAQVMAQVMALVLEMEEGMVLVKRMHLAKK